MTQTLSRLLTCSVLAAAGLLGACGDFQNESDPGADVSATGAADDSGKASGGSGAGGAASGGSAGGAASGGSSGGAPSGGGTSGPTGTLVPLYTPPSHPAWLAIVAAKLAHPTVPVIAVINPANGPGAAVSPAYTDGIARLGAAGIKILGYVPTGYAARDRAAVAADMTRWRSFYPDVEGIFFDEMSSKLGQEDYYRNVDLDARTRGFNFTVGNPGVDTKPSFVGVVDLILVYESAGLRDLASWHAAYPRERFGVIPHAVPTLASAYVASTKKAVGFIYMTNDSLPNPWDSLPPYFGDLLTELAL